MKRIISLIIVSIYLSGCTTGVTDDEIAELNQQIGSLESKNEQLEEANNQVASDLEDLEAEIITLEGINLELTENNTMLEEELALANEAIVEVEEPDDGIIIDTKSYSQTGTLTGPFNGQRVIEAGYDLLAAFKVGDMNIVASYVSSVNNVKFSPTLNFSGNTLVELTPTDIINMATNTTIYNWGNEQVTNNPINMTISDYFDNYVYDEDYYGALVIGQNNTVSLGSVPNDLNVNYGSAVYHVEFLLPDYYTTNTGSQWRSITFAFLVEDLAPQLLGVYHGY